VDVKQGTMKVYIWCGGGSYCGCRFSRWDQSLELGQIWGFNIIGGAGLGSCNK